VGRDRLVLRTIARPSWRKKITRGFLGVRLHAQDFADSAARWRQRHGAQLPVVESTLAQYAAVDRQGFGDEDISDIYPLTVRAVFGQESIPNEGFLGQALGSRLAEPAGAWQAEHVAGAAAPGT